MALRNLVAALVLGLLPVLAPWADAGAEKKPPAGMALVPEGDFLMGSSAEEIATVKKEVGNRTLYADHPFDEETPKKRVRLKAFYIDLYEVTNREYAEFVKATGRPAPQSWKGGSYAPNTADNPVLFVQRDDAEAYAKWRHKRLPTEEEWEKAARGTDGRVFPWGNTFEPDRAATADSTLEFIQQGLCAANGGNRVGLATGDVSPYGAHDMAGNVREWTSTVSSGKKGFVVVKGGSWVDLNISARAAYRELVPDGARSHIISFRCAMDAE